jgi:hypothetical protein
MSIWGVITGRSIMVQEHRAKGLLADNGIKIHGWHWNENGPGYLFFVKPKQANRALKILREDGITIW